MQDWIESSFNEELYALPSRLLVLLPAAWKQIPRVELDLLTKILNSVRESPGTIQVLTTQAISIHQLEQLGPKVVLAFGVSVEGVDTFYSVSHKAAFSIIQSHALSELDETRKKQLWSALRSLFLSS
ncbi:MAG: hypothetical protein MUE95_06625 [Cyclobacteriaceae bacterium]|jgi:hypothetical protein|nr:hypothetical protein [Cyclobacteriaceae bacterium]